MSQNIRDAESCYLQAQVRFAKTMQRIMTQWYGPEMVTQLAGVLQSLPPEIREQMNQKTIDSVMNKMRGG